MREDGDLTELKVEEEKVLISRIDCYTDRENKVQYKGHVDQKGNLTGWGSYVISDKDRGLGGLGRYARKEMNNKGDTVHTGTFLDGRKEGIFVEKEHEIGQDTRVIKIVIREYLKGGTKDPV